MLEVVAAVLVLGVLREAGARSGVCCRGRERCEAAPETKVAVGNCVAWHRVTIFGRGCRARAVRCVRCRLLRRMVRPVRRLRLRGAAAGSSVAACSAYFSGSCSSCCAGRWPSWHCCCGRWSGCSRFHSGFWESGWRRCSSCYGPFCSCQRGSSAADGTERAAAGPVVFLIFLRDGIASIGQHAAS
jgi:hypothetical protein